MVRRRKRRAIPRRQSDALAFSAALMSLRTEMKWGQDTLARKLDISRRTLVNWECGYWLPPLKQRLHVVLALRDLPPAYVLQFAAALGVSDDDAVAPFLAPYERALTQEDAPPLPPPPPPPPRPTHEQLRAVVDPLVRDAADAMDARGSELRAAIVRVLTACAELGANLDEARGAVAARTSPKGKGKAG